MMLSRAFRGLWLLLGLVLLFRSTEARAQCTQQQGASLIRSQQMAEIVRLRAAVVRSSCPGIAAHLASFNTLGAAFNQFTNTLPRPNPQSLCVLADATAADVSVMRTQVETALAECAHMEAFRQETCGTWRQSYDPHAQSLRAPPARADRTALAAALDARVLPVRALCTNPDLHVFSATSVLDRERAKGALVAFIALSPASRDALTVAQVERFPSAPLTGGGDAPSVISLIGGAATGSGADATALISLLVQGVSQFVATRARAEFNLFVIERLRRSLCTEDTVPKQLMERTCAFLSTNTDFLSASFGATFVASIADDASHLPQALGIVVDRAVGDGRAIKLGTDPFSIPNAHRGTALLLARTSLALVSALGESTDIRSVARAVEAIAERTVNGVSPYCGEDVLCGPAAAGLRLLAQVTIAIENQRLRPDEALDPVAAAAIVDSIRAIDARATLLTADMVIEAARDVQDIIAGARQLRAATTAEARVAAIEPLVTAWVALVNLSLRATVANPPQLPEGLPSFVTAIASGSMPRVVSRGIALVPAVLRSMGQAAVISQVLPPEVIRALQFGADLSAATSPEQVSSVIESVAMPVGGWQYKGRSSFAITLGSFVGLASGGEFALGTTLLEPQQGYRGQLFAPVGFDFTGGLGCGWTFGAMISVINVGSMIPVTPAPSVPTMMGMGTSTSSAATRQMNPLSFIEPGAFLRFGIANTPVVLGAGASYLPYAHRVERTINGAAVLQDEAAVSVFGFLSIDVSIWQVFQIPRKVGATENL